MNGKLIISAVGVFGYGILVGWALTADHFNKRLKDKEAFVESLLAREEAPKPELISKAAFELAFSEDAEQMTLPWEREPEAFNMHLEEGEVQVDFVSENPRRDATEEESVAGDDDEDVDEAETEALRSNLQGVIDDYTNDQDNIDHFLHSAGQTLVPNNTPPYVISKELYAWDEYEGDFYDKVTITYYPEYRLILDEDNEIMGDVAHIIGWKNLTRFGDESGDADVVFIRNRRIRIDYEVIRDEENPLPIHIRYGMGKDEFEASKAAGLLRLREEDQ